MTEQTPPQQPQPAQPTPAVVPEKPDRRPMHRRPAFAIFLGVLAALAVAGGAYYAYARNFEETDDAFVDGHVVPVNAQVSARVLRIHFDDNTPVKAGAVLVELDPTDYEVAVAQARGDAAAKAGKVEQARAAVPAAESAVVEARAQVTAAQVNFDNARRDYDRYQGLDDRAKSRQQTDNATAAKNRTAADLEQARAALQTAESQVKSAEANVRAAEGDQQKSDADVRRAEVNLGYCRVVAPCDGKVTTKAVDPGMYVTPASQLLVVVPYDVWVTANYKETQLAHMTVGQRVTVDVDAYPGRAFTGTVQSIQSGTGSRFSVIPAENATGNFVKVVQRVPVKITFDGDPNHADPDHLLTPGMSVEPKVRISR